MKGCEEAKEWIKPCTRHLYWSATSTSNGDGSVIVAKFKSFFKHIVNKHKNFEDPLFDRCFHSDLISESNRKWLCEGKGT